MEHVSDPTDFPPETDAPGLRKLDSAFSCQICGEVFDAPMMLNCGHSFCSMCVRRSLRDRHECPSCRSPAEEIHLVKNAQLEDLCESWRSARTTILELIEKADNLAKAALSDVDARPRKKRRLSDPTTPRARRAPRPSTERSSVEVIEDSEEEAMGCDFVPSSDTEENEAQMQMDLLVDCPVCGQSIVNRNANAHIDSGCRSFLTKTKTKQTASKSAWSNILGNRDGSSRPGSRGKGKRQQKSASSSRDNVDGIAERLPKPSYTVLKDKKLREMLADHQLPTTGSREQLIARHTQFVLLFNANLDRAEHLRKPVNELKKDLRKWENGLDVKKVLVDDAQAYVKDRNAEFRKHIDSARSSLRSKKEDSNSPPYAPAAPVSSEARTTPTNTMAGNVGSELQVDSRQKALVEKMIISDSEGEDVT